jgi:cellulose synthase operon protein C
MIASCKMKRIGDKKGNRLAIHPGFAGRVSRTALGLFISVCCMFSGQSQAAGNDAAAALERGDYTEVLKGQEEGTERSKVLRARALIGVGKAKEAETSLASFSSAEAKLWRGVALGEQGKFSAAIELLRTVPSAGNPTSMRARITLSDYLIQTGKRKEADVPLRAVIAEYQNLSPGDGEGLLLVGRAARLLRKPKNANQALMEAERAAPKSVELLLERSSLFLEKYDPGHAEELARDALKVAPNHPEAKLLIARIKLEQSMRFKDAGELVQQALAVNPRLGAGYAILAGMAIRDGDLKLAEKHVSDGLAQKSHDLELLSLRAAIRFLRDDRQGFEAGKKEVLSRNPEFSEFYTIASEFAEWEHRYSDIVTMMKEAVKVDSEDGRAWGQLALTQLRSGDEDVGLQSLLEARKRDHFNIQVHNTLKLYEETIPARYQSASFGPFRVRMPKAEEPMLARYMPKLIGEAYASMKARYGFTPELPLFVEFYESKQDFSIRTAGLPNIGIQGVCFGRMVASLSPKGEVFNWGNVVWHELGHVFAIALSKSHVPRWFTEGLSEYETIAKRPEWSRELDQQLYVAIKDETLPKVVDMNRAFTHAEDGNDMTVAYYASSQIVLWTVERFGMPRVLAALRAWGEGLDTGQVIEKAFGVAASQYDADFRAWYKQRHARYQNQFLPSSKRMRAEEASRLLTQAKKDGRSANHLQDLRADLGLALLREDKSAEGVAELAGVLKENPNNLKANFAMVKVAVGKKDLAAAKKHLDVMVQAGGNGYAVALAQAELAEMSKDEASYEHALRAAHHFDPTQALPIRNLTALAREKKRESEEREWLGKLAMVEQHDPTIARAHLTKLVEAGQMAQAATACESALYVDLSSTKTHTACARAKRAMGKLQDARFEAESALLGTGSGDDMNKAYDALIEITSLQGDKRAEEAARAAKGRLPTAPPKAAEAEE